MKNIMIGEGKNDSDFSNELLSILDYKPQIFDQKSVLKEQKKHQETAVLRSFIEDSSPYDFLFKSEGGKHMAAELFARYLDFLLDVKNISKTILMLDIDGTGLDEKLKQIEGIIIKKMSGEKLFITFKNVGKNIRYGVECIYFYEAYLITQENEKQLGKFYLILFNRDLEEVANRWFPNREISEKDKIIKLAKDKEIIKIFSIFLK